MDKQMRVFDAILTLGLLAALSISTYALVRGRNDVAGGWEYKILTYAIESGDKETVSEDGGPESEGTHILLPKLNELGRQGWELVSTNLYVTDQGNDGIEFFSFKRRK